MEQYKLDTDRINNIEDIKRIFKYMNLIFTLKEDNQYEYEEIKDLFHEKIKEEK